MGGGHLLSTASTPPRLPLFGRAKAHPEGCLLGPAFGLAVFGSASFARRMAQFASPLRRRFKDGPTT